MDIIIEFIVWLVKALAGDGNKGKPVSRGGTSTPRGPYNYGDGRGAGARPKTLEEILEEVKRQQAQGKGGAPRAAAPRQAPAQPKAPSLSRPLSEIQQNTAQRPTASSQGGAIQSKIEKRAITPNLDDNEGVKPGFEKKFEKLQQREDQIARGVGHTKMVAEISTIKSAGEIETVDTMQSSLADKKSNTYADYFKAMRGAPLKTRAEMARRALVFSEVFGPPRSKRPLQRRR